MRSVSLPMGPLPIDELLADVEAALRVLPNLILVAEPGAGKTTRVPPFLLERGLIGESECVFLLQPRRLAARAVASRIAQERGWELGGRVGYQVRFENRFCADTRLLVMTEGIFTRRLLGDSELKGVGCVVLDEFHERSLHTDFAIALLKEIQSALRPELKIVVMSATLDTARLEEYLPSARVLRSTGRRHPVRITRAPEISARDSCHRAPPDLAAQVISGLRDLLTEADDDGGDILVFLPGIGEIRRVSDRLGGESWAKSLEILELHGSLGLDEQARVLRPRGDRRRVILSTNIAETSLTVPGVRAVIDSGLARVLRFDPARGFDRLEVERISRASLNQRAGRAGREGPGRVYRLLSAEEEARLKEFEDPEIRRVSLEPTLLFLASWGVRDFANFDWFEAPRPAQLEVARQELERLGALEVGGKLTDVGKRLLGLPVPPRLGRALLEARGDAELDEVARALALLEEKDPVADLARLRAVCHSEKEGDLALRLEALRLVDTGRGPRELGLDSGGSRRVAQVALDLARNLRGALVSNAALNGGPDTRPLVECLWPAFWDRLCRRRAPGSDKAVMVGGRGVLVAPESDVRRSEFFLALDLIDTGARLESRVRLAEALEIETIRRLAGPRLKERVRVELGADLRASAVREVVFEDLTLEGPFPAPVPRDAETLLAEALVHSWETFLAWQPRLSGYLRRRDFVRRHVPEAALAEIGPAEKRQWAEALVSAAAGRSLAELPAWEIVSGLVGRAERQRVDQEAPESIGVPSGREMALDYGADLETVTVSVKLQELFGLAETPRVLAGRVPVTLELLSPGQKPVQVTRDLSSFWKNGYPEVRKELRARYPKHPWPEDPWTAKATHRTKPRGT